jgi:hypothetical protein
VLATPSEHNYAEVLSSMDIEAMKARKTGASAPGAGNKRYVVVSLTISGAKFHYPLGMSPV